MEFLKVEGLGNDFVLFEGPAPSAEQVREWCDRRTGIGADGVLWVTRSDHPQAVARMGYWNSNGSAAAMCGNGLRCVARYVFEQGWTARRSFTIETAVGLNRARILADGLVRVELGPYRVGSRLEIGGRCFTTADMGNPHAVTFVEHRAALEDAPLGTLGPSFQDHPSFPDGVNVEFALVTEGGFRVRVWERGAGETRACGTGAAAVAAVAARDGRADPATGVELPGGSLGVQLTDGVAWISGPALVVFSGRIPA